MADPGERDILVLVVDDDPEDLPATAERMQQEDGAIAVETATDGAEVVAAVADEETGIDAVLSDYAVGAPEGLELLEAVRATDRELPFVLFTADGSEAVASEAIARGVTDYVPKGVGPDPYAEVTDRIRRAVERVRSGEGDGRPGDPGDATPTRRFVDVALDALDDVFVHAGDDGALRWWNDRLTAVTGYDDAELAGMRIQDLVEESAPGCYGDFLEELQGTGRARFEVPIVAREGEARRYEGRAVTLPEDADADGYVSVARDVTERANRGADLAFFEEMVEETGVGIAAYTADGRYRYVNEAYATLLDRTVEEVVDEPIWAVNPALDRERFEAYWSSFESGETREETTELERAGGDRVPVRTLTTRADLNGTVYHFGTIIDRSRTVEAEAELRRETNRFDSLMEQIPVGIYFKNRDGEHVRVSDFHLDRLEAAWGTTPDGEPFTHDVVEGRTDGELLPPDVAEGTVADDQRAVEGEEAVTTVENHDGTWVRTAKAPWYDEDDEVTGLIGISIDITERKQYEQDLERQNRRLDRFAGILSHDLRNPLNVATGSLALAREECDSEYLETVAGAHERMATLIDDLLTITREGYDPDLDTPVDLDALVEECADGVEMGAATVRPASGLTVYADRSLLRQLFENLLRNAVEHGGADVTVTVGGLEDGFYVEDDGVGIPAREREQILEAGYSTHSNGVGLGLSIVTELIEAHGWTLSVTEGEDGGACFEVRGVDVVDGPE